jgi:mRNA-degrading endonuclease toxin of MazEF toxin-antitoxin module
LKRGEIWHVDLEPVKGKEQQGKRYVLVISPESYNKVMGGLVLIAPITIGGFHDRIKGFTVSLTGAGTLSTGVVLCGQLRAVDLKARNAKLIEHVPDFIMDEVLAKLATIIG